MILGQEISVEILLLVKLLILNVVLGVTLTVIMPLWVDVLDTVKSMFLSWIIFGLDCCFRSDATRFYRNLREV